MRALITTDDGVQLVERPTPEPHDGEVEIEVVYAGICRTDLAVADGAIAVPRGRVIGHELAGRVIATRTPVAVVPFTIERDHEPRWLGIDRDGAFADRVRVPVQSLVPIPRDMSMQLAAFVEPMAAALGVLPSIDAGQRVYVEGHDRIAELVRRVIAARGGWLDSSAEGTYDVVVETSGVRELASLLALVKNRGTLVLKSRAARNAVVPAGAVVARDLLIRGASHGAFGEAVEWLHGARIAIDDLLAPPRPLESFVETFAAARQAAQKQMFRIGAD